MEDLLKCPVCGSEAEYEWSEWDEETETGDDGLGTLMCSNPKCHAVEYNIMYDEAIEKWGSSEH